MNTPTRALVSLVSLTLAGWLVGCSSPGTAAENKSGKSNANVGLIPVLEIGLPVAAITEQLGRPADVQPMDSPGKAAEIWIYHLPGPIRVTQVVTGMKSVPAMPAPGYAAELRLVDEPVYSMVEQQSVVTLQLLIIDGHLSAQKSSTAVNHKYN